MNIQRLKEIREDRDLRQDDVAKVLQIKQQRRLKLQNRPER